jgi:hypothetical protein
MEMHKLIEKWKKEKPEEYEEIRKIIDLCEKFEIVKLQPIVYPQVQFKTQASNIVNLTFG